MDSQSIQKKYITSIIEPQPLQFLCRHARCLCWYLKMQSRKKAKSEQDIVFYAKKLQEMEKNAAPPEDFEALTVGSLRKAVVDGNTDEGSMLCGLIAGIIEGEDKIIKKVYFLTNTDHSNEHFSLDPKEQLAAIKDMRSMGLVPLGNWHSHPESPSRPSEEDKRLAYDSKASYMILSLVDREKPVLNSFKITGNDPKLSEKEELVIEE